MRRDIRAPIATKIADLEGGNPQEIKREALTREGNHTRNREKNIVQEARSR
jgi:hypothetical protein